MKYASIKKRDVANGPGVRVSLFVSGCNHHCKGCFNPEAWDFNYGLDFTNDTIDEIIDLLKASNKKYKQTLIVITHDEKIALEADRIITIQDGKLVKDERK